MADLSATTTTTKIPNAGSPEARQMGCTCAVLDNAHGIGYHGIPGQWVYTQGCPLHWPFRALEAQEQKQ